MTKLPGERNERKAKEKQQKDIKNLDDLPDWMIGWKSENESHVFLKFVSCNFFSLHVFFRVCVNCGTLFQERHFIADDFFLEQSIVTKIRPYCQCFVIMTRNRFILTKGDKTKIVLF